MDRKRHINQLVRLRVKKFRLRKELQRNFDFAEDEDENNIVDPAEDMNEHEINEEESVRDETDEDESDDNETNEDGNQNHITDSRAEPVAEDEQETNSDSDDDSDAEANLLNDERRHGLDDEEADFFIEDVNEPEIKQLKEWAVETQINQDNLDKLLKILRFRLLTNLPQSSKTFLGTSGAKYALIQMEDGNGSMGEFTYFGIADGLKDCINVDIHKNDTLELQIACDGLRLVDSGYQELWPIVCKVDFDPDIYKPFTVCVYFGETKPNSTEAYMSKFIDEINALQQNGLIISNRHFNIRLKCFISDTPARALLKCTVGHTAFNACERCTVQGFKEDNTTVYPSVDSVERTDQSFRARSQATHHHRETPLVRVFPFLNLIFCFVLDFMHLCCLGVMKRLLESWLIKGRNKLSRLNRIELSRRMKLLKSQIPCEFQRKIRSTDSIRKWKATEYRFFLLYCGVIVLINLISKTLYKHFLLFFAACRILCSDKLCQKYREEANQYLRVFFIAMGNYYGPKSQVLNSHHLIHLADDVKNMKCSLSRITAFPFESYLGKLKKYIRTANKPLAQLCRRLHELRVISSRTKVTIPPLIEVLKSKQNRILSIKIRQFTITTEAPNNTIIMKDNTILDVKEIIKDPNDQFRIRGEILEKKKPLFTYPFNSKHLQMWQLKTERNSEERIYNVHNIDTKLVKLSINLSEEDQLKEYVLPLLHI